MLAVIKSHLFLSEEIFKGILAKHQHVTSKAAIDFLLEETLPIQRNELLWNLLIENILKPCFNGKNINSKNKVFVTHSLCSYYRFLWSKCKDLQRKGRISQVFCLGAVVTIRVTENSPAIKILHERDLMVYHERPPDSDWKIIMLSSVLSIVIVNFRLYVNPW